MSAPKCALDRQLVDLAAGFQVVRLQLQYTVPDEEGSFGVVRLLIRPTEQAEQVHVLRILLAHLLLQPHRQGVHAHRPRRVDHTQVGGHVVGRQGEDLFSIFQHLGVVARCFGDS